MDKELQLNFNNYTHKHISYMSASKNEVKQTYSSYSIAFISTFFSCLDHQVPLNTKIHVLQ
jgi:hypothetical protein